MYLEGGTAIVDGNVEVSECVGASGGGFYGTAGAGVMLGGSSRVTRCIATSSTGAAGGGVVAIFYSFALIDEHALVSDCHVYSVVGFQSGGGLFVLLAFALMDHEARVDSCSSWTGGGVDLDAASLTMLGSATVSNCTSATGGGLSLTESSLTMSANSSVEGCTAEFDGGGCYIESGGTLTVTNAIFRGNVAERGGAVFVESQSLAQFFSSKSGLVGNFATASGGGVAAADGMVTLRGAVQLDANWAVDGGGTFHLTDGSRLFISSGCTWINIMSYFDGVATAGLGEFVGVVRNTRTSQAYDARGDVAQLIAEIPTNRNAYYCLEPGEYAFDAVSGRSFDYEGGSFAARLLSEAGAPLVGPSLSLQGGEHTRTSNFVVSGDERDAPTEIKGSVALQTGSAVALSVESAMYAHNVRIANCHARDGAVHLERLSTLDMYNCTFVDNTASASGGAVYADTLSTLRIRGSLARGNQASALGGALFVNTADVSLEGVWMDDNAVHHGNGGGMFVAGIELATMSDLRFTRNQVSGGRIYSGAALAAFNSAIELTGRVDFTDNVAESGTNGGAVAALSGSSVWFPASDEPPGRAVRVDVVIDFSKVAQCLPTEALDNLTCDAYPASCGRAPVPSGACYGCGCWIALERHVSIVSSSGEQVARTTPRAAAVRTDSLWLPSGTTYTAQAIDEFGDGWFGATFTVIVFEPQGAKRTYTSLPFTGSASERVTFIIAHFSSGAVARNNRAVEGGGGALWWEGVEPVGHLQSFGNAAKYGDDSATPPTTLARVTPASNASGRSIEIASDEAVDPYMIFAIYDRHFQLVKSIEGAAAVLTAVTPGTVIINNVAEFVLGQAVFRDLRIVNTPGTRVQAKLTSDIVTLDTNTIALEFVLRNCSSNEVELDSACTTCDVGEYIVTAGDGQRTCRDCPRGVTCSDRGQVLEELQRKAGWWRATLTSRKLYRCYVDGACPRDTTAGDDSCKRGHEGVRCLGCGYNFYKSWNGKCRSCTKRERRITMSLVVVLGALGLGVWLWLTATKAGADFIHSMSTAYGSSLASTARENSVVALGDEKDASWLTPLVVPFKTVISFYQIVAAIPVEFNMPRIFVRITFMTRLANLSLNEFLATQCLWQTNSRKHFEQAMFGLTLTPIALILFLVLFCAIQQQRLGKTAAKQKLLVCTELAFVLLHILLPPIASTLFLAVQCSPYDFGDEGRRTFVNIAPTVSCESSRWRFVILPYAVSNIVLYVIGVPLVYAVCLFKYRHKLNPRDDTDMLESNAFIDKMSRSVSFKHIVHASAMWQRKLHNVRKTFTTTSDGDFHAIAAIRFLWSDYKPRYFYWEVVEIARRVLLTLVLAVVAPGKSSQLAVAFVLSTCCALVAMHVNPCRLREDNMMLITAQWGLAAIFFIALCYDTSVLLDTTSALCLLTAAVALPAIAIMYVARLSLLRARKLLFAKMPSPRPTTRWFGLFVGNKSPPFAPTKSSGVQPHETMPSRRETLEEKGTDEDENSKKDTSDVPSAASEG